MVLDNRNSDQVLEDKEKVFCLQKRMLDAQEGALKILEKYLLVSVDNPQDPEVPANQRADYYEKKLVDLPATCPGRNAIRSALYTEILDLTEKDVKLTEQIHQILQDRFKLTSVFHHDHIQAIKLLDQLRFQGKCSLPWKPLGPIARRHESAYQLLTELLLDFLGARDFNFLVLKQLITVRNQQDDTPDDIQGWVDRYKNNLDLGE